MSTSSSVRENEVAFCGDIQSWSEALFARHPEWPFSRAAIEHYGPTGHKRQDLRFFRRGNQSPVISGEVKMLGTPEGQSPYQADLMQDAYQKSDNIQCPFFFTWNVNAFVLFDRSRWNVPMIQRRVRDWELGIHLANPSDCRRPDVQAEIREKFLPRLGVTGDLALPKSEADCRHCLKDLNDRLRQANERFAALAASRTGNAEMQEKTASLLLHWYIHGRG
ncbi:MAG: hypothetical protein PHW60_08105 [Kiritimatiellae bacterium]|nr:hypothetical protein [Kiritimatiellia bacterium]